MKLHIEEMLSAQKRHVSFHTPGHKRAGGDITELGYSDCLYSPHGVIAEAEKDIAQILGAERSFILTDGSTSGVFAMIYALKAGGVRSVAAPAFSHPSVLRACRALGVEVVPVPTRTLRGIPLQPEEEALANALGRAEALLLTSPDYYGFFAPLAAARRLCDGQQKPLVVDGAHGAHLHGTPLHAGAFADMWVDGAHKSLPALTQGAAVSAKSRAWAERLLEGVRTFRTTSPSYPVMASVEYAFKYPRNTAIERTALLTKEALGAVNNDDWTKILVPFRDTDGAQAALEEAGVYCEFNDGNYLMFYLSPCTKAWHLKKLTAAAGRLPRAEVEAGAPAGAIALYAEEE